MLKNKKAAKAKLDRITDSTRGQAAIERAEILARGGNAALIWRSGGIKGGATVDQKKRAAKNACRGRVSY